MKNLRSASIALVLFAFAHSARADIIVNAVEVGGNVVFSGGGHIDLDGLELVDDATIQLAAVGPSFGTLSMGGGEVDVYDVVTGPTSFGSNSGGLADSFTGDDFAIVGILAQIRVPHGYVSGEQLSATMTFKGETFESLGMTPGTYVWTWGGQAPASGPPGVLHSFTLNIGGQAIPEPSTYGLCGAAVLGLILFRRRVRRCSPSA